DDRASHRPRRWAAGLGWRGLRLGGRRGRKGHWDPARLQQAPDLPLDIVGQLHRAGLGEVDAVAAAQLADLAVVVGAADAEIAVLLDEAVPHVPKGDPGLLGARAVDVVEIGQVAARAGAADRRQPDPHYRNTLALERRNGLVDPAGVELAPLLRAELMGSAAGAAAAGAGRGLGLLRFGVAARLGVGARLGLAARPGLAALLPPARLA